MGGGRGWHPRRAIGRAPDPRRVDAGPDPGRGDHHVAGPRHRGPQSRAGGPCGRKQTKKENEMVEPGLSMQMQGAGLCGHRPSDRVLVSVFFFTCGVFIARPSSLRITNRPPPAGGGVRDIRDQPLTNASQPIILFQGPARRPPPPPRPSRPPHLPPRTAPRPCPRRTPRGWRGHIYIPNPKPLRMHEWTAPAPFCNTSALPRFMTYYLPTFTGAAIAAAPACPGLPGHLGANGHRIVDTSTTQPHTFLLAAVALLPVRACRMIHESFTRRACHLIPRPELWGSARWCSPPREPYRGTRTPSPCTTSARALLRSSIRRRGSPSV